MGGKDAAADEEEEDAEAEAPAPRRRPKAKANRIDFHPAITVRMPEQLFQEGLVTIHGYLAQNRCQKSGREGNHKMVDVQFNMM